MKKKISFLESIIISLLLFVLTYTIFMILNLDYTEMLAYLLFTFYFSMILIILVKRLFYRKKLPSDCFRSPFGMIEIHFGRSCKKNKTIFLIECLVVIMIGIEENTDVLIDTWIIKESNIKRYFGDSAEIMKPSLAQRLANKICKLIHNPKDVNESYRCIIHVDRITNEKKEFIKEQVEKLQNRKIRKSSY